MRLLAKRLLLTLLIVPLLLAIIGYLFIQTTPASLMISGWLTKKYPYTISIGRITHSLTDPFTLQFHQINYFDHQGHIRLNAPTVSLTLSLTKSFSFHVTTIVLQNGSLHLDNSQKNNLVFNSDHLILKNMTVSINENQHQIQGKHINADIYPWQTNQPLFDYDQEFSLSATNLIIDTINADNVLIQGKKVKEQLIITNFGATIARGEASGKLKRTNDGQWIVNELLLNNTRWQFNYALEDLYKITQTWPSIHIKQAIVTAATFEGKDWSVNDMDITANNLYLRQSEINSEESKLTLNASQFKWRNLDIDEVIAKLILTNHQIQIKQLSSRWNKGIVRAKGNLSLIDNVYNLDELVIYGIEYVIPITYSELLHKSLSDKFNKLTIGHFKLNRATIIDTNPAFPSQLTMVSAEGHDLTLIKDHLIGLWSGQLQLNAYNATLNKVDLLYPQLSLQANNDTITIDEFATLIKEGLLEGKVTLNQTTPLLFDINMHGQNIPSNTFLLWGWLPKNITEKSTTLSFELNLPHQPFSKIPNYIKVMDDNNE